MGSAARYLDDRLGVAIAGLLGIALLSALAGYAQAGPLDPPAESSPVATDGVKLPGTPISSAPFVIDTPGHYYLTRNLTVAGATAITVNVADVSIDLGGFALSGNDTVNANGIQVNAAGSTRLSVKNGTIADFYRGVLANTSDNRLIGLTLVSNETGVSIGTGGVVSNCIASQNGTGILVTGSHAEIRECHVTSNASFGIRMNASGPEGLLIERTSVMLNNTLDNVLLEGLALVGGKATLRDSVLSGNKRRDGEISGYEIIVIDNVITCPTSVTFTNGLNNFVPINSTDPHTNRSHKVSPC